LSTDRFRRFAAAAAIGLTAGCIQQQRIAPGAREVIVHAVLDVGVVRQHVIVQQTYGSIETQFAVEGAVVTLQLPGGRVVTAAEVRDSTVASPRFLQSRITTVYRFSLDSLGVVLEPGGAYHLRVAVPDGRVVTGTTTLPGAQRNTAFDSTTGFDRARDTLSMAWARVPGARSYEVFIRGPVTAFSRFSDTAVAIVGWSFQDEDHTQAFAPNATHQVIVNAVDRNYYDYYRRGSDLFSGAGLISHLDGGLGVFGSIVRIKSRTVFVK
jgi:hypothetical protein